MEKRLLAAAGLSLLILVAWNLLFPPPERPRPAAPAAPLSDAAPATDSAPPEPTPEVPEPPTEPVVTEPVAAAAASSVQVETGNFEVTLTNEGATVVSWKLRDYRTVDDKPLELLPTYRDAAPKQLGIVLDDAALSRTLDTALWQLEREPIPEDAEGGAGERLTFRWADGRGLAARKSFAFRESAFLVGIELEVTEHGRPLAAALALGPGFGAQELASSYYYEAWVVATGQVVAHRQKRGKGYEQGASSSGPIQWAGLEDQYFSALLLPNASPTRVTATPVPLVRTPLGEEETTERSEIIVAVTVPPEGAELFVGPKRVELLAEQPRGLERCIWYFDNGLLAWITRRIHLSLLWIHDRVVPNYGVAIVLATVILRLLLFPVNQYAMVNMKKTQLQMQKLQPKIKRIRERYRKNKDATSRGDMNKEMMDLVGSSRVDLQACKLEYSIVSPK